MATCRKPGAGPGKRPLLNQPLKLLNLIGDYAEAASPEIHTFDICTKACAQGNGIGHAGAG